MLFNLDMLTAVLFGLVEGITEWLPVSSTGHMILLNQITSFYTVSDGFFEMFEVVIQLGAICAVIIPFFWKLFPFTRESGYVQIKLSSLLLWGKIIVATIPAAIVGFFFDDAINAAFYNPMSIAIALIVVGFVFIAVERAKKGKKVRVSRLSDITFLMAFVIGMFQTIAAVFPGTSRSGITIIAMLLMGFSRKLAVEFTFLLAIPVMLGASLAKLVKFGFHFAPNEALLLLIGVVVAFLVSIFVIRFIVGYIKKHTFIAFGWYRIILGVAVIVLFKMFL